MNKKIASILATGLATLGLGILVNQNTAHAATTTNKYAWSVGQHEEYAPTYYNKSNSNAYIWNTSFKKRIHNLKNYPNTTWYVTKSFVHNKKVYYKLSNFGGKVTGYTWSGNLSPYVSKNVNSFSSDSSYLNYLNSDKSQKLSRALLKLFPNADISLDLSKKAAASSSTSLSLNGYTKTINLSMLSAKVIDNNQISNGKPLAHIETVLQSLGGPASSAASKAKSAQNILNANGYTSDKIASLINQGYKLGIYISDGAAASVGSKGYPSTIKNADDRYVLVLAK
ncbi:D-alanyl-D-alanine carboxypeptidase [Lentilactobacillus sp. SPB1-3]|uniref:D-alanyl-D-alanine carboxypeptidase n=1 Tax=Lentilactobacillus terminaliae TaxID=3003483 RepID=A0ACD5DGT3_9LACO|nr:D-alanyl-D-alanine carboxypeptidase [Lentilactobacillus sp. SPB1-3]MCZ0976970.1 D-alanyl-D-alanine carboxypeptidase [Lentilactobacillus sp. SPB1-3]